MSSRGSKRGGRGGKATSGGRYFTGDGAAADAKAITKEVKNKKLQKDVQVAATPAAAVNAGKKGQKRKGAPEVATAQKEQTKKVAPTPTATAEGGKKGQKRKGSPAAKKEQTKKAVVAEEASPQQPRKQRKPKAERMGKRAWEEDEEKVEKVTEAAPEVEDDDSDVDSEVSLPSDSEDSDFEQVVAKESGSARFKAALALRDTFQNFREENAEDEDDEDEDESEDEEEIKKRTQKLGDYVSLKSDSDDDVVVEDYFNADAEVDDDDDAEEDNAEQKPEGEGKTTAKPEQAKSKAGDVKQKEKKTTDVKKKEKKGKVGQPATKKRRVNARSLNLNLRGTGAVYLGHLPSGFYKEQMQGFFSQFGRVLRISHPLSKKTGRSKGYAFILFEHKEVAQVVAETMHGYLISNRILRCKYIPSTQIPKHMFKNAQTAYPSFDRRQAEAEKRGTVRSATKHKKLTKSLVSKENKRRQKLKALGFDYDFPGYAAAVAETTKAKQ